jgi:pimeloyl-ACP methyl ester carboxylesterase
LIPKPTGTVTLPDGRRLAYDDVGDSTGAPVVYLHGCPDCRLTRHPDDGVAARAGARLIAVDRPGYGESDPDLTGDDNALAADVIALADALGLDRFAVLGWSSGGPGALALAARHPDRVAVSGVAAGQVPVEEDSALSEILGDQTIDEFATTAAALVAIPGMTIDLALEHVVEGKPDSYLDDLASVEGLLEQLALGLVAAVEHGLAGAERDMRCMVSQWPFDLSSISVPVMLWYGVHDVMLDPAAGQWLADRIPQAQLEVVDTSHLLPLVRWESLLTTLVNHLDRKEANATQP